MYSEGQVEDILASIGLDPHSEAGEDLIIFCPYHNNRISPAGEVSMETGLFYCFSCYASATLEKLIMHVTGRSYLEAIRVIDRHRGKVDMVQEITKKLKKEEEVEFDRELVARLNRDLHNSPRALAYIKKRQIDHDIDKFMLGYSESRDMITVPVHYPSGKLMGFVARSIEGKEFQNTPGLKKSKTLFNLHRVKLAESVILVESSFDAIKLDAHGIPAVATLGAAVSKTQIELLDKYFIQVYMVPDTDEAGIKMTQKVTGALGSKVVTFKLPSGVKDVGELEDSQLNNFKKFIANPLGTLL